jgi:hypothetical protein
MRPGPAPLSVFGPQPAVGREGPVEIAAVLATRDDLAHPVQHRAVPVEVLVSAHRGQMPGEREAGGGLPPGVQQPGQRDGGRRILQPGHAERRSHLGCDLFRRRVQQRFAGRVVGVDGLPAYPGRSGDVLDAGLRVHVEHVNSRLHDWLLTVGLAVGRAAEDEVKAGRMTIEEASHAVRHRFLRCSACRPPAQTDQVRAMLRHRAQRVRQRTLVRNRIHAILADHGYGRCDLRREKPSSGGSFSSGRTTGTRGISTVCDVFQQSYRLTTHIGLRRFELGKTCQIGR